MLTRNPRVWVCALLLILIIFSSLRLRVQDQLRLNESILKDLKIPQYNAHVHSLLQPNHKLSSVHNSTLGFEKVFVINLPARTDKHDGILLASKLTDFDVEFINGVDPAHIYMKAVPQRIKAAKPLGSGVLGCWRAHINFLARVVEDNLATALVLEDDVDWDVRLKQQLDEFATSTSALFGEPEARQIKFQNIIPSIHTYTAASPYGDDWDVLLLGNCGVDIDKSRPYVVHARDDTVADLHHLDIYGDPNDMRLNPYPSHARLAGYAIEQTCTYAYAVTQRAARQLLLDIGMEQVDRPIDMLLRDWCEGRLLLKTPPWRCIGVLPSLFESYRAAGDAHGDSDIEGDKYGIGYREQAFTPNIRKSVRMNMRKIMDGAEENELDDQYPNFAFTMTMTMEHAKATDVAGPIQQ